jgi:hypothetical protein
VFGLGGILLLARFDFLQAAVEEAQFGADKDKGVGTVNNLAYIDAHAS